MWAHRLLVLWVGAAMAAEQMGRATYYGKDEFSLNDGTCACHKQGLWDSNPCSNNFCFDWIGESKLSAVIHTLKAFAAYHQQSSANACTCTQARSKERDLA